MAKINLELEVTCSQCNGTGEGYVTRCDSAKARALSPPRQGRHYSTFSSGTCSRMRTILAPVIRHLPTMSKAKPNFVLVSPYLPAASPVFENTRRRHDNRLLAFRLCSPMRTNTMEKPSCI
jgi:hypothetical protein